MLVSYIDIWEPDIIEWSRSVTFQTYDYCDYVDQMGNHHPIVANDIDFECIVSSRKNDVPIMKLAYYWPKGDIDRGYENAVDISSYNFSAPCPKATWRKDEEVYDKAFNELLDQFAAHPDFKFIADVWNKEA